MTHLIVALLILASHGSTAALTYSVVIGVCYFFLGACEEGGLYFMEFMGLLLIIAYFLTDHFTHDVPEYNF